MCAAHHRCQGCCIGAVSRCGQSGTCTTGLALAATWDSARSSSGGKPSACTAKTPLWRSSPSATTMQFSAGGAAEGLALRANAAQESRTEGMCSATAHPTRPPTGDDVSVTSLPAGDIFRQGRCRMHAGSCTQDRQNTCMAGCCDGTGEEHACEEARGGGCAREVDGQRVGEVLQEVAPVGQLRDGAAHEARLPHAAQQRLQLRQLRSSSSRSVGAAHIQFAPLRGARYRHSDTVLSCHLSSSDHVGLCGCGRSESQLHMPAPMPGQSQPLLPFEQQNQVSLCLTARMLWLPHACRHATC